MPDHQPAPPIPPAAGGQEDVMSAEPRDRDASSAGRQDVMSAEPRDRDTGNG